MKTFHPKMTFAAIAGASTISCVVGAVNVNSNGTGQALLYPYYTTRSSAGQPYITALTIANTRNSVKAVKVRFFEGKGGQEVLDFNLYLSPHDVWTAAIVATTNAARVITSDKSCTVPAIGQGIELTNVTYLSDPAGPTLDRTREGYFEILEMGVVGNATVSNAATQTNGIPANCTQVITDDGSMLQAPTGGLIGSETLINVNAGTDYTADPTALVGWRDAPMWTPPGAASPDLADVSPKFSTVSYAEGLGIPLLVTGGLTWGGSNDVDAVSAALMHESIYNEFVLDSQTLSQTDWVVTFPTKRFYYTPFNQLVSRVTGLFQSNFTANGACDAFSTTVYDREHGAASALSSPLSLCWAANTITFNNGGALGSSNQTSLVTTYPEGWMQLSTLALASPIYGGLSHYLVSTGRTDAIMPTPTAVGFRVAPSVTYVGLPSIGFSVNSYSNGTLTINGSQVLSNYGGNFSHKYTDQIVAP